MKKIGIITFHHYCNYGTMLQALALQQKIEQLGYEAELIDYMQNNQISKFDMLKLRLKRLPVYVKEHKKYKMLSINKKNIVKKNEAFEYFYKNNLKVGIKKYSSLEELMSNPPLYDGYIVGSDQTWNPYVAGFQKVFFLPFVKDDTTKGSYAPSISVKSIPENKVSYYKDELSKFSFLSCREKDGKELLEKITGRSVEQVIDPTLLLTQDDWSKYMDVAIPNKPYILVYFLGDKKWYRAKVAKLQKVTGWDVITLPVSYLEMESTYEKKWCGPEVFLSLINGASLICTDSFHGTIFSINFKKNFYSFCKTDDSENSSENSRLYSVLELFGLSDRLIRQSDTIDFDKIEIDYVKAEKLLLNERKKSTAYLENMLKTISKGSNYEGCN